MALSAKPTVAGTMRTQEGDLERAEGSDQSPSCFSGSFFDPASYFGTFYGFDSGTIHTQFMLNSTPASRATAPQPPVRAGRQGQTRARADSSSALHWQAWPGGPPAPCHTPPE